MTKTILTALVTASLLTACAHQPDQAAGPIGASRALMRTQGAALVIDGCVARDSGVTGYYLVGDSRRLAAQAARGAGELLKQKQVALKGLQLPLLCGSLSINPLSDARIADGVDQTRRRVALPMPLAEALARDAALTDAYRRLMYVARADPTSLAGEQITPVQAALLREKLGASTVLVVMVWAQSVDAGPMQAKWLASVVDLQARAVVWTDVQLFRAEDAALLLGGADPAHAENHSALEWLRELTHPYFDR